MKKLFLAAAFAAMVLSVVPAAAMAEGRIWVYEFDDETETSATWVYVDTACDTTAAGAHDGAVVCYLLNSAPWAAPEGALPNGSHHAPVAILD